MLRTVLFGILLMAGAALSSCGDDGGTSVTGTTTVVDDAPGDALPSWLAEVYPEPGANAAPERVVEVGYDVLPPRHELRVIVDGVDVTYQLDGLDRGGQRALFPSPGDVRYDPESLERPLVSLEPGSHEAAVRLVRLPEEGAQLVDVDEFAWSFVLQ